MFWLYNPSIFLHFSPQHFKKNNVSTFNLPKEYSDFQNFFSEIQGNGM